MKRGFTLIELLAVIVILAIIALIATPIVLNIINDAKESARLRSADFYLDAVGYAISKRILEGKTIEDGVYNILESGNICIGTLDGNTCKGEILEVEVDGERPNGEKITIKGGQIVSHVIKYGDVIVKSEGEGDESSSLVHNEIAEGAYYGNMSNGLIWYSEMPATISEGDFYLYGDYMYSCMRDGWTDALYWQVNIAEEELGNYFTDITFDYANKNQSSYGAILESINGQPVTHLFATFINCKFLTTAPTIPSGVTSLQRTFENCSKLTTVSVIPGNVTNMIETFKGCTSLVTAPDMSNAISVTSMQGTFSYCTSLTTAPVIPDSVTCMAGTFAGCSSLTGRIDINANPEEYMTCFDQVDFAAQNLTLTGSSTMLAEIGATGTNYPG